MKLGMLCQDSIGQEIARACLRPAVDDELRHEMEVSARIDLMGNTRGDDRQDCGGPLTADVATPPWKAMMLTDGLAAWAGEAPARRQSR